jgi:hypothetical protein
MSPNYNDPRWNSEDPYIRATVRARAITSGLAYLVERNRRGAYWTDMESVLRGGPVLYSATYEDPAKAGTPIPLPLLGNWSSAAEALRYVWDSYTPIFAPDHPLRPVPPTPEAFDEPENMKRAAFGDR